MPTSRQDEGSRRRRPGPARLFLFAFALAIGNVGVADAVGLGHATAAPVQCDPPAAGAAPRQVTPGQVGLDPAQVEQAMAFAESRNRLSLQIYRNNCLVAASARNTATQTVPWNVFSSTKSVVSMLAGIAWGQGKLNLTAPIGRYLPKGIGDRATERSPS